MSLAAVALLVAALLGAFAPAAAQGGGSVTVDSYLCPDNWGVEGITPKDLGVICDDPVDGPAFVTISSDGFQTSEKVSAIGRAMFQGVPYGPIEITHTLPRGYGNPAVFCADTHAGAGAEDRMEVGDGATVSWELNPDAELWTTCEFFFMPAEGDTADASSRVTLTAWSCPAGTDVAITTIGTCEEATADTTFALAGGEMDLAWDAGLMEDRGTAVDLAPAAYTFEATPADAGVAAVHWRCGALGVDVVRAQLAEGVTAELTTEAGTDYRCDWFVVAAEGDPGEQPASIANVVLVAAIACPDGVEATAGFAALAEACPVPVEGRPDAVFQIEDPVGSSWSKGSTFSANGFVMFEFTEAPLGQMQLSLQPIDGFDGSVAWCSDTGAGDLGAGAPASADGTVSVLRQPDAPEALTCVFFVTVGTPAATPVASPMATPVAEPVQPEVELGTVHVASHFCPVGTELTGDEAAMAAACAGPVDGRPIASYALTGQGDAIWFKVRVTTTNAEGVADAEFDEVTPGEAVLKQEIPEGYAQAMVFCGEGAPGEAAFGEPNSWNEATILEIAPGATMSCVFYNVPG